LKAAKTTYNKNGFTPTAIDEMRGQVLAFIIIPATPSVDHFYPGIPGS
jgi:hypothetical protein